MITDFLENPIEVGDTVAIATTRGIRVGVVEKITAQTSDYHDTTYSVKILRDVALGVCKMQTFHYEKENFFLVSH